MAGSRERMLHKPEAIQEQLPVAWKHLCDSRRWERTYIYVYTLSLPRTTPPKHHFQFLFISFKEVQERPRYKFAQI